MKIFSFLTLYLALSFSMVQAQHIENICKNSADLSSTMCWKHSMNANLPNIFTVNTNQYQFDFSYDKLDFEDFQISKKTTGQLPHLQFGLVERNKEIICNTTSVHPEDCQLVHTGRFLQHRFINWLPQLQGCNPNESGLEIISWNDRLVLSFRLTPIVAQRGRNMFIRFQVPVDYHYINTTDVEGYYLFKNKNGDDGFIISATEPESETTVNGNVVTSRKLERGMLAKGRLYQTGLIIYPVKDVYKEIANVVAKEKGNLKVSAVQTYPEAAKIECNYDKKMGWYRFDLRNDSISGSRDFLNNRIERVKFIIENKHSEDITARLNFSKEGKVYGITGISAMIRDKEGYPTGIPVQLSKNWHDNPNHDQLYRGPWFHGLTTLNVPANSKIELEYTGANAFWGGVPAASHAQLCLIGWGSNQLWEQSAIGAWGENICYEPDMRQVQTAVLDVRPLNVASPKGQKWGWTGNVGGADILRIYDTEANRVWHSGVVMEAKRNCPNKTEVAYSGNLFSGKAKFEYTATLGRSDDMTRGIYQIKFKVLDDIQFSDFDIFQLGSLTYHYANSRKIAIGNDKGLKEIVQANNNTKNVNDVAFGKLKGENPWVYMYESHINKVQLSKFVPADRGFILRNWNAKLEGKENCLPHWKERVALTGHGDPCSIMTITLPEDCKTLQKGDYIEAEVEMIIAPMTAEQYYGGNKAFKKALYSSVKSPWKIGYREARGNDIDINMLKGKCLSVYPIDIQAENNEVQLKIKGGIGYVPLTIKGLNNYKKPVLYVKEGAKWIVIDQSVHGNDFWQTDFNSRNKTWEITYNINLDKYVNKEFKFNLE